MSTPTTNMAMGKGVDTDNARTYIETTLGAALDTLDGHDHSVTAKGLPPTRIAATTTIPASGKIVSPGAGDLFDLSPGSLTGLRLQGIASAVNYTQVANSATGNAVVVSAQGTDSNVQLTAQAKGTSGVMLVSQGGNALLAAGAVSGVNYVQVLNAATTGGPVISAVGSDTNIQLNLQSKGTAGVAMQSAAGLAILVAAPIASAVNYVQVTNATTGNPSLVSAIGADANVQLNLQSKGTAGVVLASGTGVIILQAAPIASAVNYYQVVNAATGNSPYVASTGTDANIGARLLSKGTSGVTLESGAGLVIFGAAPVASAVNYIQATNSITGVTPNFSAVGTDTNIGLKILQKGTGSITIGDANGTVNISGGNTVVGLSTGTVGFFGVTGNTRNTVGGSRGGNAALADLLSKLVLLNLIVDGTTA